VVHCIGIWILCSGLERCGKSCRLRWTNYLRPDIKRGKFSMQEEQTIIQLHALLGNRFCISIKTFFYIWDLLWGFVVVFLANSLLKEKESREILNSSIIITPKISNFSVFYMYVGYNNSSTCDKCSGVFAGCFTGVFIDDFHYFSCIILLWVLDLWKLVRRNSDICGHSSQIF